MIDLTPSQQQDIRKAIDTVSDAAEKFSNTYWDHLVELLESTNIKLKTNTLDFFKTSTTTWSDKLIALAVDFFSPHYSAMDKASIMLHESVHLKQYKELGGFEYYLKMAIQKYRWQCEMEAEIESLKFRVAMGNRIRDLDGSARRFLDSHSISQKYFFATYVKFQQISRL